MDEQTFELQLNAELVKHSDNAKNAMQRIIDSLPEKARQLNLEIFGAQDGDGLFSIRANLDGPDLYVLNKTIDHVADIFDPKYVNGEITPYIPTVDPFDIEYEANDVVVDCAAKWLSQLWEQLVIAQVHIPVFIIGHDEYGTITPIQLK
ncbi:MAG: hypothetical protein KZQ77_09455 [Candidatus Thiodiazotropha sp. (ex Notomyrtea botanica)]|nr:hypothetical protein [Candidatus Thiodiazotropha sp. (ex Notomyrtea botanica)]